LQTFALLFVKGHYHASQATAELALALLVVGMVIGTIVGGRLTDRMLARRSISARACGFPGACYIGGRAAAAAGILGSSLTPALWFDVGGAALISAANTPIQAARLDVVSGGCCGDGPRAR